MYAVADAAPAAFTHLKERLGALGPIRKAGCAPYWKIAGQFEVYVAVTIDDNAEAAAMNLLNALGTKWLVARPFAEEVDAVWTNNSGTEHLVIPGVVWANVMAFPEARYANPSPDDDGSSPGGGVPHD
jgi:hypothetical protein